MPLTKEQFDIYIQSQIANVARDKAAYNIDCRKAFTSHHEASAYLREEIEELEEEVHKLNTDFEMYWYMCKNESKCSSNDYYNQLQSIEEKCNRAANEVLDTYAVVLKTIEQMKCWKE